MAKSQKLIESYQFTHWLIHKMADIYDKERGTTVGDRVAGLHWHETYYTGQLEILRALAGKD